MGGLAAGKRDSKITFERAEVTQDEYGEEIETWVELGSEYARTFYGRGNERREAAAERSEMPLTFGVLANTKTLSITARDRIRFNGLIWNIAGVAEVTRGEVEITAVAAP
jgi:SPP1 family predicted phage head-tail adaptor